MALCVNELDEDLLQLSSRSDCCLPAPDSSVASLCSCNAGRIGCWWHFCRISRFKYFRLFALSFETIGTIFNVSPGAIRHRLRLTHRAKSLMPDSLALQERARKAMPSRQALDMKILTLRAVVSDRFRRYPGAIEATYRQRPPLCRR